MYTNFIIVCKIFALTSMIGLSTGVVWLFREFLIWTATSDGPAEAEKHRLGIIAINYLFNGAIFILGCFWLKGLLGITKYHLLN